MSASAILVQFLNGLASASSLFLVAAGLSLIFGVTRILNFAHGSLYMLGAYCAVSLIEWLGRGPLGFWGGVLLAPLAIGVLGALIEVLLLRRIYQAPDLLQLLATFALVLMFEDFALWAWGPEDLLGPRAPGLDGAVTIAGRAVPEFDLFLIVLGPAVLGALWLLLTRTRWGTLVRAAAEDREMAGALGVNQALLFTSVFALGSFLAGLGGAVNIPREPANLLMDLTIIADVFVVVVVGGMGSIPGAFLAALLIAEIKAFCIGIGDVTWFGVELSFSKLTLVVEFIVMAVVLILRPWGLLGHATSAARGPGTADDSLRPASKPFLVSASLVVLALVMLPALADPYSLVLLGDILVFALFAASLHFISGPAGLHSFGHAAYFGLGAYGAALLARHLLPMEIALFAGPIAALAGALLYGWFCVRLSGVYLAMLTLAFAQITWSILFQWDAFTGGSNGLVDVWPSEWLSSKAAYYWLTLALCAAGIAFLWRVLYSPFGYALRAARDAPLRAEALGIHVARMQWAGFAVAGTLAGLAGAVYAFSKGSISPDVAAIPRSVDGLVMVLLGGIQTLTGPVLGAAAFTWLQDTIARETAYWRALLGAVILLLVLAVPQGLAGLARLWPRGRRA
jgi:branched-chain amino acid transport system permease protein